MGYLRKNIYLNQEVPVGAAVKIIATVGHGFTKRVTIKITFKNKGALILSIVRRIYR